MFIAVPWCSWCSLLFHGVSGVLGVCGGGGGGGVIIVIIVITVIIVVVSVVVVVGEESCVHPNIQTTLAEGPPWRTPLLLT